MNSEAIDRLTRITDFWTGRLIAGVIAAAFILSYAALLASKRY